MKTIPHSMRSVAKLLRVIPLVLIFVCMVAAQPQSQYDHGTPPQHVSGISDIGSYLSTELGSVNLSNGALNMKIPVGSVGGRGFTIPLTLNYSSKVWSATIGHDYYGDPYYQWYPAAYAAYDDPARIVDVYDAIAPGWTIGAAPTLKAKGIGIQAYPCPGTLCGAYHFALVRLTLLMPDGAEVELRDDVNDGAPLPPQQDGWGIHDMDGYRGTRWHATDGSGTIFIAITPTQSHTAIFKAL